MTKAERRKYNREYMRKARAQGRFCREKRRPPYMYEVSPELERQLLGMDPRQALAEFHRLCLHSRRGHSGRIYALISSRYRHNSTKRGAVKVRR